MTSGSEGKKQNECGVGRMRVSARGERNTQHPCPVFYGFGFICDLLSSFWLFKHCACNGEAVNRKGSSSPSPKLFT